MDKKNAFIVDDSLTHVYHLFFRSTRSSEKIDAIIFLKAFRFLSVLLRRIGTNVYANGVDTSVLGQTWHTRVAVDSSYAGEIGHKMEQCLLQQIGTIDKLRQSY